MRNLFLPFFALGLAAHAQPQPAHAPQPVAVQVSYGVPAPEISWYLPPGVPTAGFRVLQRRQYVGEAGPRQCRLLFQSRSDSLLLLMVDTLPLPQGIHEYRLEALDSTGQVGATSAWTTVSTLSDQVRPFATQVIASSDTSSRVIRLSWRIIRPERVRSVRIYRAEAYDGPYALIAERPATDTLLADPVRRVRENYFYRIQVVDIFGPGAVSVPVPALARYRTVCLPPILLGATAGTGGVLLRWQPQGDDIKGFFVQRRAAGDTAWRTVSGLVLPDTLHQWKDTTAQPGLLHAWRMRALSTGDRASAPSGEAMALQPSAEAPPPPDGLVARRLEPGRVTLSWTAPVLSNAILAGYRVERSNDGGTTFTALNKEPVAEGENGFTDTTAGTGATAYRVRSIGPAGQVGVPGTPVQVDGSGLTGAPSELIARRSPRGVVLTWPSLPRQVKALRVYRSTGGGEPVRVAELGPDAGRWVDGKPPGGTSFYVVRAVGFDGKEGEMSTPVAVHW
ncbi:MAG: hypothetical protein IT230_05920 [Flavobacteriales bacterium]|jgi:hypothetical protein|nr:hypothetical protein [Flavobacteriales bacterium]